MNSPNLLASLNDAQRAAVSAPPGNSLVLAGAGSGKTRVLVHRIAYLLEAGASPYDIMAVTFTNKAAREMRSRIETLLGLPLNQLWMGTFHGIAHRLLRIHWEQARLPQNFQILDGDDQLRMVRRVIRSLNVDEQRFTPRQATSFINAAKDEGKRPKHLDPVGPIDKTFRDLYVGYEAACQQAGAVDFAELLLRSHELWLERADILAHYRNRFRHLLVDEFQDTNGVQYAWLKLLAGSTGQMMAVGDDDQSIYGWRGAKIENILRFEKDFAPVVVYRLEQNYRSTGNILQAANAVIEHNAGRLGKELWTETGAGDPLLIYAAYNELDEARFIADRAHDWIERGGSASEVAVLYRSNAQSRVLEEAFLRRNIPYRIYGGMRFFERAEIRDALAYLRLAIQPGSDAAFERVVNTPPRGIGDKTIERLREFARLQSITMWEALNSALLTGAFTGRSATALANFAQHVALLTQVIDGMSLQDAMQTVLEHSRLEAHHGKEAGERGIAKVENLRELVTAARQFTPELRFPIAPDGAEQPPQSPREVIEDFLAHAALEAGEGQAESHAACVQLMTLHSAKGLEFPLVFLAGMDEGVFPHRMSDLEPNRLEEERRLCYVGITRAMRQLYLCHAEVRRLNGIEQRSMPSRFIREIPKELISEIRLRGAVVRPAATRQDQRSFGGQRGGAQIPSRMFRDEEDAPLRIGQRVRHASFGEGVVLGCEGHGERAHVHINFETAGEKRLILGMARLESVE